MQESEKYEDSNQELMKEIKALEEEKKHLEELMNIHEHSGDCLKDLQEIHIDPWYDEDNNSDQSYRKNYETEISYENIVNGPL